MVNFFIVYELDTWSQDLNVLIQINIFILNIGIGLDSRSLCSHASFDWGKNTIIFGVVSSSSVHIDNNKKAILVLGKGPTQELDDTTITTKAKYFVSFTRSRRKFCFRQHYNESKSFLFVNVTKMYLFKTKDPERKPCLLCLGNISIDCAVNNMKT